MSAEPKLVEDPVEVRIRLRELGLEMAELTGALLDGASAMALCTEDHPPNFGGISFWAECVRSLRFRKGEHGWLRNDARNYSTVVNPERTMQIAVSRGDEWTGKKNAPDGKPSTLHKKGPLTQLAVETNQLALFDRLPEPQSDDENLPITTWVLLHFREKNKIRAELSHPTAINKSGFVEAWAERIVLAGIDLTASKISLPDDQPVEPEVVIKRRG